MYISVFYSLCSRAAAEEIISLLVTEINLGTSVHQKHTSFVSLEVTC